MAPVAVSLSAVLGMRSSGPNPHGGRGECNSLVGIEILPNDPQIHLKGSRRLEPVCKSLLELQERAATATQSYAALLGKNNEGNP